jgi:hypothetical protein
MEYSLGLMIRDRQIYYLDRTSQLHAVMQTLVPCRGEVDQLQEAVNTNEAHLGDSYSFFLLLLGCPSWPHQTHYLVVVQSTGQHQDERQAEAKEPRQNSFQSSGHSHM